MDDTVWFQIVVLFGKIFRYSVLFLVFTVFTSSMYFFLQFPFNPPLRLYLLQKSYPILKGKYSLMTITHKLKSGYTNMIKIQYEALLIDYKTRDLSVIMIEESLPRINLQ